MVWGFPLLTGLPSRRIRDMPAPHRDVLRAGVMATGQAAGATDTRTPGHACKLDSRRYRRRGYAGKLVSYRCSRVGARGSRRHPTPSCHSVTLHRPVQAVLAATAMAIGAWPRSPWLLTMPALVTRALAGGLPRLATRLGGCADLQLDHVGVCHQRPSRMRHTRWLRRM